MLRLENRHIIISGASSGIGRACAIQCSQQGAKVSIFGRDESRLAETFSLLHGDNHFSRAFDITNENELATSINLASENLGRFDGFIHCAGIQKTIPLKLTSESHFAEQYNVNVISAMQTIRQILRKRLWSQNGSSIIFIASIYGIVGSGSITAYSATKGALISGSKSLAIELAPHKIRVNCISPGIVENTLMTENIVRTLSKEWEEKSRAEYPLGWVCSDDIASAALFLLSEESKRITGINLVIDGGYTSK